MLHAYFNRIGFDGAPRVDLDTLVRIHRGHAFHIPYENLDVQLGRDVTRDPQAAFSKIVERGRGGWCYEMNGLLGMALDRIGFKVRRLAGAVLRETRGDAAVGNHLVLLIDLGGETWLCDVGFGDGLTEPRRLVPGDFSVGPYACSLDRIEGGWWRYRNDARGGAPSFDFHEEVADERLLESSCQWLQSDTSSPFIQNAIVQRWAPNQFHGLVGRVLSVVDANGKSSHVIDTAEDYIDTLRRVFALDLPEATSLWPKILASRSARAEIDPSH